MYRKASDPSFIDAGMEEELQARLSAGSRISIWWTRFRTTRRSGGFGRGHKRGLARALFAEELRQLEEQGMLSKVWAPVEQALGTLKTLLRALGRSVHWDKGERGGSAIQGDGVQPAARGRVERGLLGAWVGA